MEADAREIRSLLLSPPSRLVIHRGVRYLALLPSVAVPMNADTAIFIWYLTPLNLAALGSGPAEIARIVVLYCLALVLFGPTVARLSDTRIGPNPSVLC